MAGRVASQADLLLRAARVSDGLADELRAKNDALRLRLLRVAKKAEVVKRENAPARRRRGTCIGGRVVAAPPRGAAGIFRGEAERPSSVAATRTVLALAFRKTSAETGRGAAAAGDVDIPRRPWTVA